MNVRVEFIRAFVAKFCINHHNENGIKNRILCHRPLIADEILQAFSDLYNIHLFDIPYGFTLTAKVVITVGRLIPRKRIK